MREGRGDTFEIWEGRREREDTEQPGSPGCIALLGRLEPDLDPATEPLFDLPCPCASISAARLAPLPLACIACGTMVNTVS